jgi:hypothetical protein
MIGREYILQHHFAEFTRSILQHARAIDHSVHATEVLPPVRRRVARRTSIRSHSMGLSPGSAGRRVVPTNVMASVNKASGERRSDQAAGPDN